MFFLGNVVCYLGGRGRFSDQQRILRLFTGLTVYAAIPFVGERLISMKKLIDLTLQFALVTPSANCTAVMYTVGSLGVLAAWLSTSLFLFRVNGVFYESLRGKIFFSCMWFFAVVGIVVFPFQYTASAPTPPHALCAVHSVKRFAFLALVPVAIFDWMVFGAISFRVIWLFTPHNHWTGVFRAFTIGGDIGIVPKALLRTGQFYFG